MEKFDVNSPALANPSDILLRTRPLWLAGFALICISLLWASVLGGMLMLTLIATALAAPSRRAEMLALLGTLTVVAFTLFKRPEGDEYYYLLYIDRVRGYGAGWLTQDSIFSVRDTEPLFKLFVFVVSKLEYGKLIFIVVLIGVVYYLATRSLVAVAKILNANAVPLLLVTFLISINVFGAAQLMRQYLAMSIACVSIVFIFQGRDRWAVIVVLLSATVHNANAIILLPVLAALAIERWPRLTLLGLAAVTLLGYFYLSRTQILIVGGATDAERWLAAFAKDDGSIPIWLIALDGAMLVMLTFLWATARGTDPYLQRFIGFALGLAGAVIIVSSQSLLFLRTYVAIEFFRPFMLLMLLRQLRLERDALVGTVLALLAVGYFVYRLNNVVFDYGGTTEDIVGIGVEDLLARLQLFDLR
ncbi:EpsG family protein [Sphingomonas psychrotolerans]|uniref:EpsG family protein n=1 Tax=Sphingomonas psychrotolerans TaxID=1327635 RepID=A0A2K8MMJ5_9SPHN|nr:EpsG family protein [Sphingomonas psychrotolerans]ATY34294.1 hypothetical protein CVN68_21950 [Sphingomonas psychrotolerans]